MLNVYPAPIQTTLDIVHFRGHEGRLFSCGHYNSNVVNGASIEMLVQSSSTFDTHTVIIGESTGDAEMYLYEGTTVSAAGTAVTVSNHNRQSAKAFDGTITHTPTVTTTGTQINGTGLLPGGTKSSGTGGETGFTSEFILALNTKYLFRVTNNSGGNAKMAININCYQPSL